MYVYFYNVFNYLHRSICKQMYSFVKIPKINNKLCYSNLNKLMKMIYKIGLF